MRWWRHSVKNTALISRNHILDVNESVLTAVNFEHLESLLNQITKVLSLALRVIDLVAKIVIFNLEQIQNRQDLSVVGDQSLSNGV